LKKKTKPGKEEREGGKEKKSNFPPSKKETYTKKDTRKYKKDISKALLRPWVKNNGVSIHYCVEENVKHGKRKKQGELSE